MLTKYYKWLLSVCMLSSFFILASCGEVINKKHMETAKISECKLVLRVLKSYREKQEGLMRVQSLKVNEGALFIFKKSQHVSIWMKNTKIPLDILFFDKAKRLIKLEKQAIPCAQVPCERYTAKNVQYVVEVNGGFIDKHNIKLGAYLKRHQ